MKYWSIERRKLKIDITKARGGHIGVENIVKRKSAVYLQVSTRIWGSGNLYLFYILSSKTNCDIQVYVSGRINKFVYYNMIILFIVY